METSTFQRPVTVVTGATGFLGGELVKQLLVDSDRQLLCPVRAGDCGHAAERGALRLAELFGDRVGEYRSRVTWLPGDLEVPRLGWSPMRWDGIAQRTVEIFHCAAAIRFDLPLEDAHRINVDGTRHVFELAAAAARADGRFSRFHHVSTAYVAGRRGGWVDADFLPPDRPWAFRNTYERTKARAERWLRARACPQVPVSIHRPSIVAGHTTTGATSCWNVLYVPMNMIVKGRLPVFAGRRDAPLDSVGVDYVVRAMVEFARTDEAPLHAHHLTAGSKSFTVGDQIRVASVHGTAAGDPVAPTRLLNRVQWAVLAGSVRAAAAMPKALTRIDRLSTISRRARLMRRGLGQCIVYLPYSRVKTRFDARSEHAELAERGVVMPDGLDYLNRITEYAVATGFGRDRAAVQRLAGDPAHQAARRAVQQTPHQIAPRLLEEAVV